MLKILSFIGQGLALLILFFSCNGKSQEDTEKKFSLDVLEEIGGSNVSNEEKVREFSNFYNSVDSIENDSLKNKILLKLSYNFLILNDSAQFKKINRNAINLSLKLKDSSNLAANFWDLGEFYYRQRILDSSYFYYTKSQEIYDLVNNDYYSARLLLNIAIVQIDIRDYTGAEITTVKAINLLKPIKKYKQLYSAYNNLGIIHKELKDYETSLSYYENAFIYLSKANREDLLPSLWNNMGVVYQNEEDYAKASEYFSKAIDYKNNLCELDKQLCAKLIDNYAYSRFKSGDTVNVLEDLRKALKIRKDLNLRSDITVNKLHLADYFLFKKDSTSAIELAFQAKRLSKETHNTRDLLSSLLLLSRINSDNASAYYEEYIEINDSLQRMERTIRNKFARIRFETDEYISETQRLNEKVGRVSLTALVIFIIFTLLYIIREQRSRNILIKQKQGANQEIYNLIIAQQRTYEEGREKEKHHISRELHDGILGKLFGVRLSLDSLNEEDTPKAKKKRFGYIQEIQKIAEEIRLISHRLRKSSIVDVDFQIVLEELIEKQNLGKINFSLEVDQAINWERVENDVKINLYRILQEIINNIHKHSKATKANVHIQKRNNLLILMVNDNGKGFNYQEPTKGIGLKNIGDRTKSINGKISFGSSGNGTFIELAIPIGS